MADMENGLFSGGNGNNPSNQGNKSTFVTALVKNNGTTTYAIKGGNANSGGLSTWYNGSLPTQGGYLTAGYPTDAADNAVQANVVSVGYSMSSGGGATGTIVAGDDSAKCVDNNNASATNGNKVEMWDCDGNTGAQNWTVNSNGTLIEWWPCSGANQVWQGANGEIVNPHSACAWTIPRPTPPTELSSSCSLQRRQQPEMDAALVAERPAARLPGRITRP